MARIDKTVFLSYRRKDQYKALVVYQDLTSRGYDVFLDYTSIHSGDFEQIIVSNIKARAHFVLILTPTALDRCDEPDDWLKREIEIAIDEKRNIVPLFFDDFSFSSPLVAEKLTGKLAKIKRYNGLDIPSGFFKEAMDRLSNNFLSDPTDAIIHPVSNKVQQVVREEQSAASKAAAGLHLEKSKKQKFQVYGIGVILLIVSIGVYGIFFLIQRSSEPDVPTPIPTRQIQPTESIEPVSPISSATLPVSTASPQLPTPGPTLGVGDTMTYSKDGMTLLFIPSGEFVMGSTGNETDERPVHTVYLASFFLDRTEVTNAMYALCVKDGECEPPRSNTSISHNVSNGNVYYGNPVFDNYPVIFVSWGDANNYCKWAGRRLPTEAEWEKAATWDSVQEIKRIYPWGENIDCSYANYYGKGNDLCVGDTTEVESYPSGASFYGILDMAGNVWEWVADRYDPEYYGKSDTDNPTGPRSGDYIVIRGGSFLTGRSNGIRSSDREKLPPDNTSHNVGFRCAMDAE